MKSLVNPEICLSFYKLSRKVEDVKDLEGN